MHTEITEPSRIPTGKLLGGIVLLIIGGLAFADAIDLHDWQFGDIGRYWPLILIVIGIGHEADTLRTRKGNGGFAVIAVGVWMLAGSLEWFGLDYRTAFPLGVVVFGLGLITHALLGIEKEKKNDESR